MSLRPYRSLTCLAATLALALGTARAGVVVADFDGLALSPNSAQSGPFDPTVEIPGRWGPVEQGSFSSDGVDFINRGGAGYWEGFAYSNQTNTDVPGLASQFSVYAGEAHSGANFGVAYGYHDLEAIPLLGVEAFNPLNLVHLEGLPYFTLPEDAIIQGMYVTNTTYTALSLSLGDDFTGRPMGGVDGNIPDWFKVTAYGTDAYGNILTDASGGARFVDLFLGDNREGQRFIADEWLYMDLADLAGAQRLYFNVSSTLSGQWGLNAPGYFAVDDVTYTIGAAAVPEPTSLAMAGTAVLVAGLLARRRPRM
ncbi:DUF4465 domain-containing protein [Paludisphaera sp.]|uniref:DUF4465 domain-containing protein n=1 Tax=Paludisphaera sp. TaxID=2017432 RepID=UPI00301C663E